MVEPRKGIVETNLIHNEDHRKAPCVVQVDSFSHHLRIYTIILEAPTPEFPVKSCDYVNVDLRSHQL